MSLGDGLGWLKAEVWEQLPLLLRSGNAKGARGQLSRLASRLSVPFVQCMSFIAV